MLKLSFKFFTDDRPTRTEIFGRATGTKRLTARGRTDRNNGEAKWLIEMQRGLPQNPRTPTIVSRSA